MSAPESTSYKNSRAAWLGELPAHWREVRLKVGLNLITEKKASDDLPKVALENIESWNGRFIETTSEFEGDGVVFQAGDLLFGKLRPYLAKVLLASREGQAVGDFHVMRPRDEVNGRYALYYMLNRDFIAVVDGSTYGAKMPRVGWDFMSELPLPIPPLEEQSAIAAFLDSETAKIDALVEEQRRLNELLKEKRQAIISHAVTKGLDPSAKLRPSGVEWMGDVPSHWDVKRLKLLTPQITVGIVVEPSKYYVDDGVPALRSLNVMPGKINDEGYVFITEEANRELAKSQLREGDLVAVRSGQPGTTAVVPAELDGANCIDLIIIRKPTSGSEWFLCWYLASDAAVRQFTEGAGGAIQQHFNIGTAMNLLVTVPPPAEQVAIAEEVRTRASKIDELVAESTRAIDLLRERRSAVISAAVTGRIDLRQAAIKEAAAQGTNGEVI